jgi:endo-1,4-beta-xylanase
VHALNASRRKFLKQVGMISAGVAIPAHAAAIWESAGAVDGAISQRPNPPENLRAVADSLRDAAASKGLLFGSGVIQKYLASNAALAGIVTKQCGIIVPEWELKWDFLRPTQDSYNFGPADWLLNFAQQHQMKFRGHTLVWYNALPKWFAGTVNQSNAQQILLDHINKVAGRYAGKMHSWDVVNEVLLPDDKRPDGLRNSAWLKLLGPSYIETAFRAAAQADSSALLVWNENWLEEETPAGDSKRAAMLAILKDFRKRGVPVQAIGIQSHLVGDHNGIAGPHFQKFLQDVSDLDLKILISELDVADTNLPGEIANRDGLVAQHYSQYLNTVLQQKAVIAVLTWGLSNQYSWLKDVKPRPDAAAVRPLPFDAGMSPTPAYQALLNAFQNAPAR